MRRRKVAPAELLEAAIERVEARNPRVNAVAMKLYDLGRRAIADGLPDGPFTGVVQLFARHGGEATIFRLAAQLEKARPWFERKPAVAS